MRLLSVSGPARLSDGDYIGFGLPEQFILSWKATAGDFQGIEGVAFVVVVCSSVDCIVQHTAG